jgi:hypothetical protein
MILEYVTHVVALEVEFLMVQVLVVGHLVEDGEVLEVVV